MVVSCTKGADEAALLPIAAVVRVTLRKQEKMWLILLMILVFVVLLISGNHTAKSTRKGMRMDGVGGV